MTSPGATTVPPQLQGYEADRQLGAGARVSYWIGRRSGDAAAVGLGILDPALGDLAGFSQRLTAVVRQIGSLRHPRIVGSLDVASGEGVLAVVTEAVDGVLVSDLLASGGPLSPAAAAQVVDDVLHAVGAAHAAGIVHCGILPERVLVTPGGEVRLDGFAVARTLALTGGEVATPVPGYSSPERLGGALPDGVGDLYAAAALAHLLFAGSAPSPGTAADVPALPAMRAALARAVAVDPQERYPSASALRAGLTAAVAETLGEDWRAGSDLAERAEAASEARSAALGVDRPADPAATLLAEPEAAAPAPPREPPQETPAPAAPDRPAARRALPRPPRARRRRLRAVLVGFLGVACLAAAGAGGWILAGRPNPFSSSAGGTAPPGPLGVGNDVALAVSRDASAGAQCDVTFDFVATGSLTGQGNLVYHFEQSNGQATQPVTIPITTQTRFRLEHKWRFQGTSTGTATLTFVVTQPGRAQPPGPPQPIRVARQFDKSCPPGH